MEFRGDGGEVLSAPLLSTRVQLTITGIIATTTYVQTFHNTSDTWVEGRYVFPLPETAAVNGMTMRIGGRLIKGEIKEKQAAKGCTNRQSRRSMASGDNWPCSSRKSPLPGTDPH